MAYIAHKTPPPRKRTSYQLLLVMSDFSIAEASRSQRGGASISPISILISPFFCSWPPFPSIAVIIVSISSSPTMSTPSSTPYSRIKQAMKVSCKFRGRFVPGGSLLRAMSRGNPGVTHIQGTVALSPALASTILGTCSAYEVYKLG